VRSAEFPERQDASASSDGRRETEAQRDDRNFGELIQELRVVSLGVQVLFGFLLSLPFTVRFDQLGGGQRGIYMASLVLSAVATVLLLGPVAYHRLVFRRGMKEPVVRFSNAMAITGLAAVGGAVLLAVLLVTDYVAGPLAATLITVVMAFLLGGLWFAIPFGRRERPR
jgi:hypothetical protein